MSLAGPCAAARFTLESAVTYSLGHHPGLAAARWSISEAQGRLLQAGRLANPELEHELKPNVRGREFAVSAGFVQKFPLTHRLRLEKAVSEAELAAAIAEVEHAAQQLKTEVRTVGVKLLALRETRVLKETQIRHSREFAAAAEKTAATGEGSPLEAAQFSLEVQQLSVDLLQLDAEQAALTGELRPLLGLGAAEPVEFTGALTEPQPPPAQAGPELAARADWRAAQARTEAARQGAALARAGKWEDISVGAGVEIDRWRDDPVGGKTDISAGFRISLPLPLRHKNEGRIMEADATLQRAAGEAQALAAKVQAEAGAARGEMQAAQRILTELDRVLLPSARALEERFTTFHKQAQPDARLADVLRAREKRLALEQARIDALRSLHLARIRFEAAAGR